MTNSKLVYGLLLAMVALSIAVVSYVRTVNPTHSVTLDAEGIVQELRDIRELISVKYVVQRVVGTDPLLMVQGNVVARVDVEKMQPSDVRLTGSTVEIRLPGAKITAASVDESQTKVWDRKISMWTQRTGFESVEAGLEREAIGGVQQEAVQAGILKEAGQNAQRAIRRMLLAAGIERVNFN